MIDVIKKAEHFLQDNNLIYQNIDFDRDIDGFIEQMELGLTTDKGLPMVPTYLKGNLRPKQDGKAIAVDVGGSNLRVALIELDDLKINITDIVKEPVLGKEEPISFYDFIDNLVDKIVPFLAHSKTICFSFAHEIKHNNKMDGTVTFISKEVFISDIKNKPLAQYLKDAIKKRTGDDVNVVLTNDTVGVAGAMLQQGDKFQNYFGVVLGTGANSCYIEKSINIKKIDDAKTDTMFINVESGSYVPSIVSILDREFDATTKHPNTATLEKMVSGEYIGRLFFYLVKKACKSNLFSGAFVDKIDQYASLGTEALSLFYKDQTKGEYNQICDNDMDTKVLYYFADCLIKRAAVLISIKILAISKKIYRSANLPICVIVEGSTFYGLKGFKQLVKDNVAEHSKEMDIELFSVNDAALVGIGNIGLAFI